MHRTTTHDRRAGARPGGLLLLLALALVAAACGATDDGAAPVAAGRPLAEAPTTTAPPPPTTTDPGNSGGPLVDEAGRVIGINDQILTDGAGESRIEACTAGNEGIGFAIAIDLAAIVAAQLVAGDNVRLAFLGVTAGASPSGFAGVFVTNVVPGSPAAVAGLSAGDLIVAVDGRPIATGAALRGPLAGRPA